MAHRIELPHDAVFSTIGREWHGLARPVELINAQVVSDILPQIREGTITLSLDGASVTLDDQKALVADYRHRTDIGPGEPKLKPLSVMGSGYHVIDNATSLAVVEAAIRDHGLDAEIVTAGTVRGGKSFFLSLRQKQADVDVRPSDKWDFHLSLVTSHDGTDAWTFYTSSFRVVCWNTLRASLDNTSQSVSVRHRSGAALALQRMPEIILAFRNQQHDMVEGLAYLAGIKCSTEQATRLVRGYYAEQAQTKRLSTRTVNAVEETLTLFNRGRGNRGETLYDLLNGFTEYFTHGSGVGRTGTTADRKFRSEFGAAAEHKTRVFDVLRDSEKREALAFTGSEVTYAN
jgi:hypothetical protein